MSMPEKSCTTQVKLHSHRHKAAAVEHAEMTVEILATCEKHDVEFKRSMQNRIRTASVVADALSTCFGKPC